LPRGTLSVTGVTVFTVLCSVGFVAGTLLFLPDNRLPLLAAVPVLLFLFSYSFAKRFTFLSHWWLGAALGLAPVAAWVVVRGEIAATPLLLAGAVMLWVAGFDIIYACQDFDFDVAAGLHSMPARLGITRALRLAAVCHLGMLGLLVAIPHYYPAFGASIRAAWSLSPCCWSMNICWCGPTI